MKRVAVTGATGFVGSRLMQELTKAGFDPIALVRKPASSQHRAFDLDMSVPQLVSALAGCDHVVHLAARVHMMKASNVADETSVYERANTEPTQRLAEAATNTGIKRFVFLSTAKVYGESSTIGHPFRTSDQPAPRGPYAQSKLHAEIALGDVAAKSNFTYAIIRPPLVYGPGVRANFAALAKLARTPAAMPFGGLRNQRSLVSVGNLCNLINAALTTHDPKNCILNAVDGQDVSTSDLLRRLATAQGKTPRLLPIPHAIIENALKLAGKSAIAERLCGNFQLSLAETRQTLNWTPPQTLDEGIREIFSGETSLK